MRGTNNLAYFGLASLTSTEEFKTLTPGGNRTDRHLDLICKGERTDKPGVNKLECFSAL